ncbi:hypothetical protein ACQY0O_003948 [Thecaphora frezii]
MRQKRTKIYRKLMHQFQLHFGFREPYQMLIDDTFSQSLIRLKTQNPSQQFANVLCGNVKPMITQCCMVALYKLGKEHQPTVDLAKQWERRKCNHREAIEPHECIKSVIGEANKHRYVLASDSQPLRAKLRNTVPGLPMVHFTQAVMVLEPMSNLSRSKVEEIEDTKLSGHAPKSDTSSAPPTNIIGADAAPSRAGESGEGEPPQKKRKGPKAPNPLSIRKPKREKLSVEEKMQREQEIKKQKQKERAAERMRAQREGGKSGKEEGEGDGVGGKRKREGEGEGEKRQREDRPEEADGKDEAEGEGEGEGEGEAKGTKKANRRRRKKNKQDDDGEGDGARHDK